jgi:hypothetical protein
MLIKIFPGEYIWSQDGFHVLDEKGFAQVASEEMQVEVTDEAQLAVIQAYQDFVRQKAEEQPAEEPQAEVGG